MPLTPQTPKLARGFDILFDQDNAPSTTPDSARVWAAAYTDYVVVGGIPAARAKQAILAAALTTAFNPELAGGGPALFVQALLVFWLGLPVPEMVGTVAAFIPTGSVDSPQPDDATPLQQADGLAATIAALTLSSVKVLIPPATVPVPIL